MGAERGLARGKQVERQVSRLSIRTAIALAAALVAAIAFFEITEELLEGETTRFDLRVSLWLHQLASPALGQVMRAVTFLGSVPALIGVVTLVAAWALRRGARALAGIYVAVASMTGGLNVVLKLLVRRSRPDLFADIVAPESYSFPSGHAMMSTVVYGVMALVVARLQPRLRLPLYIGTPLLVFLIGVSRVFLGVHWLTDVLAGFAAGGLLLVMSNLALGGIRPRREES